MDPPSTAVSREALQRQAYLLAEAAGFPPDQSEHFWLMAEQQLTAGASNAAEAPARKVHAASRRKPAAPPSVPAAEAAPVHPTRKKAVTKSAAPRPAGKVPAKPTAKAPAKPAAKSPAKPAAPPPAQPATPSAKRAARSRKPKTGDPT